VWPSRTLSAYPVGCLHAADVFVQEAWARGQSLCVHGWVYSIANGLIIDLNVTVTAPTEIGLLR
jgi:carbonic anhydrase